MLELNELKKLMRIVANANPSPTYSYSYNGEQFSFDDLNNTLTKEINEYVGSEELFEENHRKIFQIMTSVIDDVVPTRLINAYGQFAEIQQFPQGTKAAFRRRLGRARAKQFVTRVGLAGVYEVFKLGEEAFEVKTSAIGTAAQIGYEEMLDGRVNFAELLQIVMEGMDELIYREIAKALMTAVSQLPPANRVVATDCDFGSLDYLIQTASAYGQPVIYCTREFAVKMVPDNDNWNKFSDRMKDQIWNSGYLANYKGCPVVILPQSLEDETNSRKVIDPGYVWIIPTGGDNRPVKVAFEGTTHMRQRNDKDDWSRDIQIYRKVGVGVMMTNNIFSYIDINLLGKLDNINESEDDFPVGEESTTVQTDGNAKGVSGDKPISQLYDADKVAVVWNGLDGDVNGELKYVSSWTEFGGDDTSGHFFAISLDSKYKDKDVTVVSENTVKTAKDLDWVLKVDKSKTFSFYVDGIEVMTLHFGNATLKEQE